MTLVAVLCRSSPEAAEGGPWSLAAEQPLPAGGCLSPTPPSAATWASVQCGRVQLVALSASWHDTEMTPSAEPRPQWVLCTQQDRAQPPHPVQPDPPMDT